MNKPHIIGDAAFGNLDLILKIEQWGGMATFSMNDSNTTWLWDLLSYKTPPDTWRAAVGKNDIIASLHTLEEKKTQKIVHQQVVINAFSGDVYQLVNNNNSNEDINSGMYKLNLK